MNKYDESALCFPNGARTCPSLGNNGYGEDVVAIGLKNSNRLGDAMSIRL